MLGTYHTNREKARPSPLTKKHHCNSLPIVCKIWRLWSCFAHFLSAGVVAADSLGESHPISLLQVTSVRRNHEPLLGNRKVEGCLLLSPTLRSSCTLCEKTASARPSQRCFEKLWWVHVCKPKISVPGDRHCINLL